MPNELSVLCCPLTAVHDNLLAHYRTLLSSDELQRLDTYRAPRAAKEFIVGRALLRAALSERLQCAANILRFDNDANGKPFLVSPLLSTLASTFVSGAATNWHFNLSHSHDWVVLALSNIGPVGVDVEWNQRKRSMIEIAERFFLPREAQMLKTLAPDEQYARFFEWWTIKESYVKALGSGIAGALSGTEIEALAPDRIALRLTGNASCNDYVHCWQYALATNYEMAVTLIAAQPVDTIPQILRYVPGSTIPTPFEPVLKLSGVN